MKEKLNSMLSNSLKNSFSSKIKKLTENFSELSILVEPKEIRYICGELRDNEQLLFNQLIDLTVVDLFSSDRNERFQLIYHFLSLEKGWRLRVVVELNHEHQKVESISHLFSNADWLERECFDMYGIKFLNHPNLKRILTYEGFIGHPLRKDFDIQLEQPLFVARDEVLKSEPGD